MRVTIWMYLGSTAPVGSPWEKLLWEKWSGDGCCGGTLVSALDVSADGVGDDAAGVPGCCGGVCWCCRCCFTACVASCFFLSSSRVCSWRCFSKREGSFLTVGPSICLVKVLNSKGFVRLFARPETAAAAVF